MSGSLAIVIPAYKATYFRETLESIAAQTDKRFTLYIGDDCSPHDLKSIVDEYSERINIVYHRFEENLGGRDLVAHWERCVALTQDEEYIWLFSDDDVISSSCVSDFYKKIDNDDSRDVYRFNVNVIDNHGNKLRTISYPETISSRQLYVDKIKGRLECFVVEYIFKRSVYKNNRGFVKFDLAWGSDLATWVKFGEHTGIVTIDSPGISWRSSGINISTDYNPATLTRKVAALVDCLKWGERQYPDAEVRKVNRDGLISRLSTIGEASSFSLGLKGISLYADAHTERLALSAKYSVYYIYKKIRNVL
ncbi:MAG: glycosyltransferase [Duncaniella sp.]|nr:glycosyltransferase [Duncaniella sp.]